MLEQPLSQRTALCGRKPTLEQGKSIKSSLVVTWHPDMVNPPPVGVENFLVFVGWGKADFLHNSWYGGVLCVCDENSVDNSGMFWLLQSSACTELRPHPNIPSKKLEVHNKVGGGTADVTPTDPRMFYTTWQHAQHLKLRKIRMGGVQSDAIFLPF